MSMPLVLEVSTTEVRVSHETANNLDIASISKVEGRNWRHGDIEDLLKQVTCIKHHKWNSIMIKRVYFG